PGQLNQVAEALLGAGNNSQHLYSALQDGTLTFDQFNEAILRLNTEGTGAYASFSKQAMDSTDGIATAQQNFQTSIVRGMANVIAKAQPLFLKFLSLG